MSFSSSYSSLNNYAPSNFSSDLLSTQLGSPVYAHGCPCLKNPCNLVDVESELKNQVRIASRCPKYKHIPKCQGNRKIISYPNKRITGSGFSLKYPSCSKSHPKGLSYYPETFAQF